jgi:histidyl-tRNA synthetase
VLDCKDEACRAVSEGAPKIVDHLCGPCREHLDGVLAGMRDAGLDPKPAPTLVRGLDYYNRTAFEFVSQALVQAQSTLFGGGRYDGLAEALGGPHVPAVGYGMGLERVMEALEAEGVELPEEPSLDCFVVAVGDGALKRGAEVAAALRAAGVSASAPFEHRPLGAQMKAANRSGARFAVIVGERETRAGTVTLRRLSDGFQEELGLDGALTRVLTPGEAGS